MGTARKSNFIHLAVELLIQYLNRYYLISYLILYEYPRVYILKVIKLIKKIE
jgi:hypothetical protein